jgi:heavy metal sensor kinase
MFWKSIRFRLALLYTGILLMTLIAFGVISYMFVRDTLLSNLEYSLRGEIDWLKWKVPETETGKGAKRTPRKTVISVPSTVPDTVKVLVQGGGVDGGKTSKRQKSIPPKKTLSTVGQKSSKVDSLKTVVYDETWNLIYQHILQSSKNQFIYVLENKTHEAIFSSPNLWTDTLSYISIPQENTTLLTDAYYRGRTLRMAALKTSSFTYYVGYPVQEINDILNNLFSLFIYLVPVALMISFSGGWFLAKRSLRPVDDISRRARHITARNLNQQIPQTHSNDEISRLISTFNEMIARLYKSFEHTRQFSIDVSHELRTPLTIMRGEIELALRGRKTTGKYREVLASNLDEIIRMSTIIDNLLTLTKSDLGQIEIYPEELSLDDIMIQLYEDSEVLAARKNIRVNLSRVDEVKMKGDKVRLRQLLLNLVDNAVKYTRNDGEISLSLIQENGKAKVVVADTGIGIPPESLDKIFDRFYRVDKARSREPGGSGLGLSISKWIAESHGGRIEVTSEVGKGSTFTVYLPTLN